MLSREFELVKKKECLWCHKPLAVKSFEDVDSKGYKLECSNSMCQFQAKIFVHGLDMDFEKVFDVIEERECPKCRERGIKSSVFSHFFKGELNCIFWCPNCNFYIEFYGSR